MDSNDETQYPLQPPSQDPPHPLNQPYDPRDPLKRGHKLRTVPRAALEAYATHREQSLLNSADELHREAEVLRHRNEQIDAGDRPLQIQRHPLSPHPRDFSLSSLTRAELEDATVQLERGHLRLADNLQRLGDFRRMFDGMVDGNRREEEVGGSIESVVRDDGKKPHRETTGPD